MARTKIPLNTAVGDHVVSAWQVVRGIVWVQTREPKHARRMAQRKDGRLVVRGVAGGYLMTYEFRERLTWAVRLINRYTTAETPTNDASGRARCPRRRPNPGSACG
jgi:hypothetical protein